MMLTFLQSVKNLDGIGGIMLWDVSWDQNNVIGGQRYSEYAFKELGRLTTTVPSVTTQGPPPTGECRSIVYCFRKCFSIEVKAASQNQLTKENQMQCRTFAKCVYSWLYTFGTMAQWLDNDPFNSGANTRLSFFKDISGCHLFDRLSLTVCFMFIREKMKDKRANPPNRLHSQGNPPN